MIGVCNINGCGQHGKIRKGMCAKHYTRWWRHGDTNKMERAANGTVIPWLEAHRLYEAEDCLKWPFGEYVRGYGQVFYDGRPQYAHRVMCTMANGHPASEDLQALHKCGHGGDGCVNPKHLYWGTRLDNARDAVAHGAHRKGERSPNAILTEEKVLEIRALRGLLPQQKIAALYGIKQPYVSLIQNGKRWGHVTADIVRVRNIFRKMQVALGEIAA